MVHKEADWLHTPRRLGVPNALERGTNYAVAHKFILLNNLLSTEKLFLY